MVLPPPNIIPNSSGVIIPIFATVFDVETEPRKMIDFGSSLTSQYIGFMLLAYMQVGAYVSRAMRGYVSGDDRTRSSLLSRWSDTIKPSIDGLPQTPKERRRMAGRARHSSYSNSDVDETS